MTNVVLLTVDALRADHCSLYGYDRETTPTLERIAGEGTWFRNAYSTSSHTREAVPSMLSGLYPSAAVDDDFRLAVPTVATRLADTEYATAGFHSNPFASRAYGFDRDFDAFDDDLSLGGNRWFALAQRIWDKIRNHHYARAETINERSLSWLDGLDDRPFFLWNHYMDVHGPYEPPEPYRSRYLAGSIGDRRAQRLYQRARKDGASIDDGERETLIDLYDGEIAYADDRIGAFLEALEDRGLREETLVLITADHGDGMGEAGYYDHPRYLDDGLVEVPFVAVGPDVPEGTVDSPVSLVDVVPTVLRAVDGEAVDDLPGIALQSAWNGESDHRERVVFAEARGLRSESDRRRYRAQAIDDHLLYERSAGDPLGADELTGGRLERALREHVARDRAVDRDRVDAEGGADVVQGRLEALGYRE